MSAERILARCDELARLSEEDGLLTRWYGSPSLRAAADLVAVWMEEAGLAVERDSVGSVIGRRRRRTRGAFVLGSHIDTVRDAGRYDGPLGVVLAIEAAERMRDLHYGLDVVAFADEEGGRFPLTYLGSRGWAGLLDSEDARVRNGLGEVLGDAARAMGGDPDEFGARSAPKDLLGYLEVHIEQGPVLQDADLPVGIVTAIAAQSRGIADFRGMAGHAGNTPMRLRRDALAGAAELILEVERLACSTDGLTATVGWIGNEPNVGNVIPGHTWTTYDVRHQDGESRDRARDELEATARRIATRRGLAVEWKRRDDIPAVEMSGELRQLLAQACADAGIAPKELGSGAGHDAVTVARLSPYVSMLFVRCKDGVSHHPDESVREEDVAVAFDVVCRFLALQRDPWRRLGE
jgi:allantoate deiminase